MINRCSLLVLATLALAPTLALAAPGGGSDPIAERLFRDGKQLMKDGKVDEACAAYDASEKTEHNVATAMNLADCRERQGQVATAWALYVQVETESRADAMLAGLAGVARDRAAAIEPHLSYLVIDVPPAHRVAGLIVSRDHVPLDPGAWNRAIPLDGGAHLIEARAPGHEAWSTTVSLDARDDHQSIEVPAFTALAPTDAAALAPPSITTPTPPTPPTPPDDGDSHVVPVAILSGGALALAAGAGMWWHARNLHDTADATCPVAACSPDGAQRANAIQSDAQAWATGGNIALIAGGVALAGGAALLVFDFTHPRDATALRIAPQLGDVNGVALSGGF